ncbi:hypothetical protein BASA81_001705 [Batrachochytrium salamandrivorans]|nr:hypothetical protein BASA81_001705 [Batrachochytrium salamandrivorans]
MVILAKAVFKFEGAQSDDLSFDEDDVITILQKDDSGWWTGKTEDGKQGDFPYNYVEVLNEAEAQAYLQKLHSTDHGEMSFQGDRIDTIEISKQIPASPTKPSAFVIESSTNTGKGETVTKSLTELRQFDQALRTVLPNFEGKLLPSWADFALGLSQRQLDGRKDAMDNYVQKLVGSDGADFLLVPFLFPGKSVELSSESFALAAKAQEQTKLLKASAQPEPEVVLARAEYTWDATDTVEISFEAGDVLAVVSQNTGSEGWWEGQLTDGSRGLFPFNHVEILSPALMQLFTSGKPLPALATPEPTPVERVRKDHIPKTTERAIKKVPDFTLSTLQAFDEMIDKGYAVENIENNHKSGSGGKPKVGDRVELLFKAHIWDAQLLAILEFMSSEDKGEGPLDFIVGDDSSVCQGLHLAVQKLQAGESGRVIIAPKMGYGVAGSPPIIPPSAHLVYEVTLVKVSEGSGSLPSPSQEKSKPEVKARKESTVNFRMSFRKPVVNRVSEKKPVAPITAQPSVQQAKGDPKRLAGHVMVGTADSTAAAQPQKAKETPKFELKELQEIFSTGKVAANGLNPNSLEDFLTDKAFFEAFLMDRGHFLLKPLWRQQALKRAVGLF